MTVEILQLISSLALGLLVGSLLTEAMILVPYWRSMEPKEFLVLHGSLGPRLYTYFAPLTILSTLVPVFSVFMSMMLGTTYHWLSLVPAIITLVMLAIYFGYFKGANNKFKTGSIEVDGLPKELAKWANWHWVRVILGVGAFFSSLLVPFYNA